MITVRIDNREENLTEISEVWINQQINRRKAEGLSVCIMVKIKEGSLNMVLATPNCPSTTDSSRHPNTEEQRVFDLWKKHKLNTGDFRADNLITFLKEIQR